MLETASPPTYYVPAEDVRTDLISPADGSTWCEWKGRAAYFDVMVGDRVARRAAWSYPDPNPRFTLLKGHLAFYPGRVDGCYLDDELVAPQAGGFYGGWVTADIAGPMKGDPGTLGW